MKGIIIDCKTGKAQEIDDGLPMPEAPPFVEPEGVDLAIILQKFKEFDQMKADLDELKKSLK